MMLKTRTWARAIIGLILFSLLFVFIYVENKNKSKEVEEERGGMVVSVIGQDEMLNNSTLPHDSNFDTTYLDLWCGEPQGTIRMMAGWYSGENIIETEDGNHWEVNTENISDWDLLLVWLDDMNTPLKIEDDQIIKIWKEIYN